MYKEYCVAVAARNYGISKIVEATAEIALHAGRELRNGRWSRKVSLKSHSTFGTSSVTESDKGAEELITNQLHANFPKALVIGEECCGRQKISYSELVDEPLAFFVDPVDGTTPFVRDLASWCVSIGVMQNGVHAGGAIFAPDIRDGLIIFGEGQNGVFLSEYARTAKRQPSINSLPEKPIVSLGLDVQRSNSYGRFITALPKHLKPRYLAESGALGLALVAAGRIDAIVQSPQMPWDWCGGYPLVLAAHGKVLVYHIEKNKVVPLAAPTPESYRTDIQTLGFVAGKPKIVDELFPVLIETYGK